MIYAFYTVENENISSGDKNNGKLQQIPYKNICAKIAHKERKEQKKLTESSGIPNEISNFSVSSDSGEENEPAFSIKDYKLGDMNTFNKDGAIYNPNKDSKNPRAKEGPKISKFDLNKTYSEKDSYEQKKLNEKK